MGERPWFDRSVVKLQWIEFSDWSVLGENYSSHWFLFKQKKFTKIYHQPDSNPEAFLFCDLIDRVEVVWILSLLVSISNIMFDHLCKPDIFGICYYTNNSVRFKVIFWGHHMKANLQKALERIDSCFSC